MKLIDNIGQAHRLWSVRLGTAGATLGGLEAMDATEALQAILPLWEGLLPANVFGILSAITMTAAVLARVIKQDSLG
jgi:hypothetical protein